MSKTIRAQFMQVLKECTDGEYSESYLQVYADECWRIYMVNAEKKLKKEMSKLLKPQLITPVESAELFHPQGKAE